MHYRRAKRMAIAFWLDEGYRITPRPPRFYEKPKILALPNGMVYDQICKDSGMSPMQDRDRKRYTRRLARSRFFRKVLIRRWNLLQGGW